jgi:CRISPR-associated endonuclease/helicase Cas3
MLWGKTNLTTLSKNSNQRVFLKDADDRPDGFRWHSLLHHMIDVGACAEALLATPVMAKRFKHLTGVDLTPAITARLTVLVMLHDFGKAQSVFQNQIVAGCERGQGHMEPWLAALMQAGERGNGRYLDGMADALGLSSVEAWFCNGTDLRDENSEEDGLCSLLAASTFHHGGRGELAKIRTYDLSSLEVTSAFGVHPMDGLREIGEALRLLLPDAWGMGEAVPVSGDLIHWFSGLAMISDWMGSDSQERRFPYWDGRGTAKVRLSFARKRAARLLSDIGIPVSREMGTPEPLSALVDDDGRPMVPTEVQQAVLDIPADQHFMLLEAPTGDGKTEAAILRYLVLVAAGEVDSLYFAVPTRSAATELRQRIETILSRVMPNLPGKVVAAMGGRARDVYDVDADIPWAAGHPARFMAAPIAVGTIDQAYLSVMKTRHADMRSFLLCRALLVIDEVHAADPYMSELTAALAERHIRWGGHVLLMSATLGSDALDRVCNRLGQDRQTSFQEAVNTHYPLIRSGVSGPNGESSKLLAASSEKTVQLRIMPTAEVLEQVKSAVQAGARVLFIRSTVTDAVETQRALEAAGIATLAVGMEDDGDSIQSLHHGRFVASDRAKLDAALVAMIGKKAPVRSAGQGVVCVTTQTGEQSLDLNADLLISDPCPVEVFLQRLGRLHRHKGLRPEGFETPLCIILDPGDLEEMIVTSGQRGIITRGVPGFGFAFVYKNLLSVHALIDWVRRHGEITIPKCNRLLVEQGTHGRHLRGEAERLGGRWVFLADQLYGRNAAERQHARASILNTRLSFLSTEASFVERGMSTRLGEETVDIPCDKFPCAFGGTTELIQIPFRQAVQAFSGSGDGGGGIGAMRGKVLSTGLDGSLIQVGELLYRYGSHGLMRVTH